MYFDKKVEVAIQKYNSSENDEERHEVYVTVILKAFDKLAENNINVHKFYNTGIEYERLKQDIISFLTIKMSKYNKNKCKNAFSYFNTIAKRYLVDLMVKKRKHIFHDDFASPTSTTIDSGYIANVDHRGYEMGEVIDLICEKIISKISFLDEDKNIDYKKFLQSFLLVIRNYKIIDTNNRKILKEHIAHISELSKEDIDKYYNKCKKDILIKIYEKHYVDHF